VTAAAWEPVADATGIGAHTTVLDLGCGDGAFCAFAARRGAIAHGIDIEPDAIAGALKAVPGADVRLGMMESLPWSDASFDVVTSFNSLQYALDTEMALIEAARVARPDGRIAICKWGPPAENEFFAFLLSIGAAGAREESLPATGPVEDAIRATRLQVVATGKVPALIQITDEAALKVSLSRAGVHSVGATQAAAPYRQADGTYRFENRQRYWILGGAR
jgi:ubiquinone/menaquinone biosynthesis C-methylase UbiE